MTTPSPEYADEQARKANFKANCSRKGSEGRAKHEADAVFWTGYAKMTRAATVFIRRGESYDQAKARKDAADPDTYYATEFSIQQREMADAE